MEGGGGGRGKQKKGEGREEEGFLHSLSLPPSPRCFFFPFHFTWPLPHNQNTKRGQALGQCTREKKAGVHRKSERASEKGREEGGFDPTFLVPLSLLSYSLQ